MLYVCVSSPLPLLWIIIVFLRISFPFASQRVFLTFETTIPFWVLLMLGPLPLRSPGFCSCPPSTLSWSQSVHTLSCLLMTPVFNFCKKSESCRDLFFIVFIAFRCFLGGSREDSDSHSQVYARSPSWYFPNYLISIATKNVINLVAFSIKYKLIWKVNIFEVTLIAKVQAEEAYCSLPWKCAKGTSLIEFTSDWEQWNKAHLILKSWLISLRIGLLEKI